MGVSCATTVFMVVTLISVSDALGEPLQSLEPVGAEKSHPDNTTLLQEFHDHAEYKSQSSGGEDTTEYELTSELPELLPTPVAKKQKQNDEVMTPEKKLSVPKKGVEYEKPSVVPKKGVTYKSSVVPKKEVHFTSSVGAKKGADPESTTSSVSPRKGAELSQGNPILSSGRPGYDLLSISSEGIGNTDVSILSSGDRKYMNAQTKINGIENEASTKKGNLSNIPSPKLIQKKGKPNNTLLSVDWNTPQPLSDSNATLMAVKPSGSVKVSNTGHFKPTTADDPSASTNQVSYIPILMIVALVAFVVVVVAVSYRRLKDVWARRHYNYVDFLIDGMYE